MSANRTCSKNQRMRLHLDDMCKQIQPGAIFLTYDICNKLSTTRWHGVSSRTVGNMMRERDDFKNVSCGQWLKL